MKKTKGIIISHFKFKETSIIAKILTEKFGLKSYVIHGVNHKKPKLSPSLFQSLNIVEMITNEKTKTGLYNAYQIQNKIILDNLLTDPNKGLVTLTIADILDKIIKEDVIYENIYTFLEETILDLNNLLIQEKTFFLLQFLIKLTKYLGFGISQVDELNKQLSSYKDLNILSSSETSLLLSILENKTIQNIDITLNMLLMKKILHYYQIHFHDIDKVNSIKVFETLI